MTVVAPPSETRNVMLVTTELRAGGTERCVTELATRLDPEKYNCEVVCLAPFPTERMQFYERLREQQVSLSSLNARSAFDFFGAKRRLAQRIQSQNPAAVLSFLFHANVLTGATLKKFPRVPHIGNIRVADPRRWRLPLERRSLQRARNVICVSHSVRDYCQFKGHYSENRLSVIPNGVDHTAIETQISHPLRPEGFRESSGPHVGFVGRLDSQKGLDRLIAYWPKLRGQFPNASLWIAGDGPQAKSLAGQGKALGLEACIHWLGWRAQPWALLEHCDAFVFPSQWEGMSNALLEGMATGKAIVANMIEGVSEVLGPGPACQLAEVRQPETLVANLCQVLQDPELRSRCGHFNRDRVLQNYSIEGMVGRFESAIEGVI